MNLQSCLPSNAQAYLEGQLSPPDEQAYIRHLDECAACRDQLERMTCDQNQWSDVARYLSSVAEVPSSNSEDDDRNELPLSVQQVIRTLNPTEVAGSMGRLDGFEIRGVVGAGAMGVVLKAEDTALDRVVALKVMNPGLAISGVARSRFEREAKAAAAIRHPNVVAIHAVCSSADVPYLVMPYLKGHSLQKRVSAEGPMSVVEVLRIGSQIAAGLAAAHRQGVVHRDIKPSNIMLEDGIEVAIITDFGLARIIDDATMTRTGVISGTPEYMSPEQAQGDIVDGKSDVFSLGSLLYMLCTGYPPFRAHTSFGVLRRITDDSPKPIRQINPDIPEWLCRIITRMQDKHPDARPDASEIQKTLEACLAHVHQPDQIPLPVQQTPRSFHRSVLNFPLVFSGASVMLVAIIFFAVTGLTNDPDGPPDASTGVAAERVNGSEAKVYQTLQVEFPDAEKARGHLKVDINRGFIDVETHNRPVVIIEVLYPPEKKSAADSSGLKQQFSPQFDVDSDKEKNLIELDTYNQDYVLNLRIKVPPKTDLTLDTYRDGDVSVRDVKGAIRVESQHADITLDNISGSAEAYSRNGNCKIEFCSLSRDAHLDFESYNGSIDLSLPADANVTTAVSAGQGSYGSAFDIGSVSTAMIEESGFHKLSQSEYRLGKINNGGIPLRIESAKGEVSIRKTPGRAITGEMDK